MKLHRMKPNGRDSCSIAGIGFPGHGTLLILVGVVAILADSGHVRGSILELSNPTAVTHWLPSGDTHFGINANGGGHISCIKLEPDAELGDQCPSSFGDENVLSVGYGRAWQMAIRDNLHTGRHNPTQAGFNDDAGVPADVSAGASCSGTGGRVFVAPFTLPIFGNKKFDWVENEDLVGDNYADDGGNSDNDGIDESALTQADEITSEWVYSAFYEDASDLVGADVGIVRHLLQLDYLHPPDAIYQFGAQAVMDNGNPVLNPNAVWLDVAPDVFPPDELQGPQVAAADDYASAIFSYSARARYSLGYHTMLWIDDAGQWQEQIVTTCNEAVTVQLYSDQYGELYDGNPNSLIGGNPANFAGITNRPLILRSTGGVDEVDTALAVGAYLPPTPCNELQTVGVETTSGTTVYAQDRRTRYTMGGNRRACGAEPDIADTKQMGAPGEKVTVENDHTSFNMRLYSLGVLAPGHGVPGVHERVRMELYLFTGTPAAIRSAVEEMEASGVFEQSDCDVTPTCPPTLPGTCVCTAGLCAQSGFPHSDLNGSGNIDVVDTQCAIIAALWELGGNVGAPPTCLADEVGIADVNCDGAVNVTDVVTVIGVALGVTLDPLVDADGDACPDGCSP